MRADTIYWHDYETSGTDARRDRAVQFAGQRTTLDLEPIGEALTIFCAPACLPASRRRMRNAMA